MTLRTPLSRRSSGRSRRAATLVLSAVMMVAMMGIVAFAIDCGYIMLVRTQLQVAADAGAMAASGSMGGTPTEVVASAKKFVDYHAAGGKKLSLAAGDVEFGIWDSNVRKFTPTADIGNAVRVTARRDATSGGEAPLFFGRIFGKNSFGTSASAIAMGSPRDICFVVDLSGSMNDDTEPGWSSSGTLSGSYASIRTTMMKDLFTDFNFGSYPGTTQNIGQDLKVSSYSSLIANSGPLTKSSIPTTYRIKSSDSSSVKQQKAYKWIMDRQLPAIMPNATPALDSTKNYNYWADYITTIRNENSVVGYRTYVQFMMDEGREGKPDGTNFAPLSVSSPFCRYHAEDVDTDRFSFPPREQPTHACRRSLIAAIQEIKSKNKMIGDANQRDKVSIVTFDTVSGTQLRLALTSDYDAAMQICALLQACSDVTSTATETGMIEAKNHLQAKGRSNAQKVVVLLTDGMPNLKTSNDSTVSSYRNNTPSNYFYGGSSYYPEDAALMQSSVMQLKGWKTYPVGVGLGTDYDFMDRMSRMSKQESAAQAPRTSGDPAEYEIELRSIFKQIVDSPQVKLVQ